MVLSLDAQCISTIRSTRWCILIALPTVQPGQQISKNETEQVTRWIPNVTLKMSHFFPKWHFCLLCLYLLQISTRRQFIDNERKILFDEQADDVFVSTEVEGVVQLSSKVDVLRPMVKRTLFTNSIGSPIKVKSFKAEIKKGVKSNDRGEGVKVKSFIPEKRILRTKNKRY